MWKYEKNFIQNNKYILIWRSQCVFVNLWSELYRFLLGAEIFSLFTAPRDLPEEKREEGKERWCWKVSPAGKYAVRMIIGVGEWTEIAGHVFTMTFTAISWWTLTIILLCTGQLRGAKTYKYLNRVYEGCSVININTMGLLWQH